MILLDIVIDAVTSGNPAMIALLLIAAVTAARLVGDVWRLVRLISLRPATLTPDNPVSPATEQRRGLQGYSAVDGDGLKGPGGERIRLLGFDAPETWRPEGVTAYERGIALAAKARLAQLIAMPGAALARAKGKGKCKYGRTLATLTVDGEDAAAIMVREGHARPYDGGKRQPWVQ